jgi:REP-associated tyrosine transposase
MLLRMAQHGKVFLVPERLKRLEIIYQRSPIYFVTACTAKRRKLLANAAIHETFKAFAGSGESCGAWVGAYVLMPDHLHLFVALDDEQLSLSEWIKSLKGTLSTKLRANGGTPPYWQKGFFDHVLRSGDSYSEKWSYVRENPVRAGFVMEWEQWPYVGEIFDLEFHDARF